MNTGHQLVAPIEFEQSLASTPSVKRMRPEVLAITSVLLGAAGQLMVKASLLALKSRTGGAFADHGVVLQPIAGTLLGLAVYAFGTLFWLRAVARASISYLYPLSACSYILVAMGGQFLFGENIQPARWAGIVVISLGVAILTFTNVRGAE